MRLPKVGSNILTVNGQLMQTDVPDVSTVVDWTYLFDAENAVTYSAGASGYGLAPATRVDSIVSPVGNLTVHRDAGAYGALFSQPPVPGPLYIANCQRFNGRAAWYTDTVRTVQHFFDNEHSMLSHSDDPSESAPSLGIQQPWWGAMLVRTVNGTSGNEVVAIDGNPAMATVYPEDDGTPRWSASAWNTFVPADPGGYLYSTTENSHDRTFLLIFAINTTSSRFVVSYRNSAGALVTTSTTGTMSSAGNELTQFHLGWSHTNYASFFGIKSGVLTQAEVDATLGWASHYMPPEGFLALE